MKIHSTFSKLQKKKLAFAKDMKRDGNSFMKEEYCYFDGNFKRVKSSVSLCASVYHPLLCEQITQATMGCKQGDKEKVETFWQVFNKANREANECEEKFLPIGWCTDMASANFIGLGRIYRENVLQSVKG